jgi:hypothetical protein
MLYVELVRQAPDAAQGHTLCITRGNWCDATARKKAQKKASPEGLAR